jgi:hypothetical protein
MGVQGQVRREHRNFAENIDICSTSVLFTVQIVTRFLLLVVVNIICFAHARKLAHGKSTGRILNVEPFTDFLKFS